MKYFFRLSLLVLLLPAFVTSCKKPAPKLTKHIPKNALFVATINAKSIQNKLVKSQMTLENILKSVAGNDTSMNKGKQEWEDLQASGIDLDDNMYVSLSQKDGEGSTAQRSMVFSSLATLSNPLKFEAYLKKKSPKSEIKKEQDYSYAAVGNDNRSMVAWSKDMVIIMGSEQSYGSKFQDMELDSLTHQPSFNQPAASIDLKAEIASSFNMKEDESVASISAFKDLMSDNADASLWLNSGTAVDKMPVQLPKVKELFANVYTTATLNFEDGKIAVNSKSYFSKELTDLLKKYAGPTADLGLLENYPSNNINGFMVFAFNPALINAIVKYLEIGGLVDGYLTKMMNGAYSLEDVLKVFKGDMAIVVSDFAIPQQDKTNRSVFGNLPKVQMLMNIPVGDKKQFSRLMDKLVETKLLAKTGNEYQLSAIMQTGGVQLMADEKNIFLATDLNLLNQYKASTKKAVFKKDALDNMKGKAAAMYVDIESLLNGVSTTANKDGDIMLNKAKQTFKDARGYAENFNGKYMEGHYELRFKDEKQNSLASLLGFMETAASTARKIEQSHEMNEDANKDVKTDSAFLRP